MDIFAQAKARADEVAPPPTDLPYAAAATAFGFGLLVVGLYIAMEWLGLPTWLSWLGSAVIYGGIAYIDCLFAWRLNKRAYKDALADLKGAMNRPSIH